jgi:hypothetical protein
MYSKKQKIIARIEEDIKNHKLGRLKDFLTQREYAEELDTDRYYIRDCVTRINKEDRDYFKANSGKRLNTKKQKAKKRLLVRSQFLKHT